MGRKVFGVGLNKTGTTTLGVCFKRLGFRHVSCRPDLLRSYRAGALAPVWAVADAHDSFEDWPWPLLFREIYERYGDDARFVLTVRSSPDVWLDSLKKHSLRTHPRLHCRKAAYGFDYPHGHEAEHLAAYVQHNADVRAFFAGRPDLFLEVCWEEGDGWEKLCDFLSRPVPDEPFPHANRSEAADARLRFDFREANLAQIQRELAGLATQRGPDSSTYRPIRHEGGIPGPAV